MKDYEQILANVKFITKEDKDMLLNEFEILQSRINRLEHEIEGFDLANFDTHDLAFELEYRGIKLMPKMETMIAQDKLEKYIEHLTKNPCEP